MALSMDNFDKDRLICDNVALVASRLAKHAIEHDMLTERGIAKLLGISRHGARAILELNPKAYSIDVLVCISQVLKLQSPSELFFTNETTRAETKELAKAFKEAGLRETERWKECCKIIFPADHDTREEG